MKEIGSIFSIDDYSEPTCNVVREPDTLYYSLCREALYEIASTNLFENKTVLIPAYTCFSVIEPFTQEGWQCYYYDINTDLRINTDNLIELFNKTKPSLCLFHPYYGCELNETEVEILEHIHSKGCAIIADLTQCIFSSRHYQFADFCVASIRKWFPITDGGYLKIANIKYSPVFSNHSKVVNEFVDMQKNAMYLKHIYENTGDKSIKAISRQIAEMSVAYMNRSISAHSISPYSLDKYKKYNDAIAEKRMQNVSFLSRKIRKSDLIQPVIDFDKITSAPLYYPIYASNRDYVQKELATNGIYAPKLWNLSSQNLLISDDVKYLYNHILAIPCDQRYDILDMNRIVEVLNSL